MKLEKTYRSCCWVVVVGLLVVGAGCKGERSPGVPSKQQADSSLSDASQRAPQQPVIGNDLVNAIYPHYLQVEEALVQGNAGAARLAASNIEAGARAFPGGTRLADAARRILNAPDLVTQRQAFAPLSEEMIKHVKSAGVSGSPLYVAFCPMARDNEGAPWLTSTPVVRNPYYGAEMLTCGEIQDTIRKGSALP